MEKYILLSFLITFAFFLVKLIEIRYLDLPHEKKTMKQIFRDIVFVFICSISTEFIYFQFYKPINEFFNLWTNNKTVSIEDLNNPPVNTSFPTF